MAHPIEFYQRCIKKLLCEYEEFAPDWAKTELIFDDERRRYIVLHVGWLKEKHIHHCLVHMDIVDDKIVIQENNTEDLLKTDLIEMGVPAEKIELGFIPAKAWTFAQPIDKTLVLEPA
jgi:hypothetical protein